MQVCRDLIKGLYKMAWLNYKSIISFCVFLYCLYYVSSPQTWHFIDNVDLVIHEAGHVVFAILGEFLYIAGGTLLQIIFPAIFVGYFFFKDQQYSASLLLYWVGINFIAVSIYAGDALKMQLELLTGDKDGHDWNNMLFMLGQLRNTEFISHVIFGIGIVVIFVALLWGIKSSVEAQQRGPTLIQ